MKRFKINLQFKKEDAWIGVYWDQNNIWICLIPFLPIHLKRRAVCYECQERIDCEFHHDKWWHHGNVGRFTYGGKPVDCSEYRSLNDEFNEDFS